MLAERHECVHVGWCARWPAGGVAVGGIKAGISQGWGSS